MIVVDTNVVVAAVIRGADTALALAARARDRDWIAPSLLRSEFLNALSKYVIVAGSLDRDEAVRAFRRGLSLVSLASLPGSPVDILNVIIRSRVTAYDVEFVALAIEQNVRVVTLDGGILKACPGLAVGLADFAAGR